MDTVLICISFIVTILGIAYPILFQVVSRLDEKYSSILILELFNKEKARKLFLLFLITSLFSILIWAFKIPPLIKIKGLNYIIENSAFLLLSVSSIALIITFLLFVEKILIYYTPTRFLQYLIKEHKKKKNKDKLTYFIAISDLLYYSIRQQNETIAKTISDFMYVAFKSIREENEGKPIEYPASYYEVIYKSIEELGATNSKKLIFLEYRTIGAIWLLGELKDNKISETTYSWIWRNLLLAISYKNDDIIMHYWKNAHKFFSNQLQRIMPAYSHNPFKFKNKDEVKVRDDERERFLEFHYALGGLLLYERMYECLGRAFKYTTNIPPKYELLPGTMGEIFKMYIQFRDPYEMKYTWISHQYTFPNLDGLHSDGIIKNWINEYIAVLFIRQYSIQPNLITMKPLELPPIPKEQSEKKKLLTNLDYFASLVEKALNNQDLLEKIKLGFIKKEWFKENNKPEPIELINQYKSQLEEAFDKTQVEQDVSDSKRKQLDETSTRIIKDAIELYYGIKNNNIISKDYNNWFINGERAVMDKSAFTDNQDTHHLNFDSFLAEHIAGKYKSGISETFFYTKTEKYLLKPEDIFPSINKLKINSTDFVIINFAQNLSYLKELLSLENLSEESYRGIKIISFSNCNHALVGESFFIIRKSDFPNIIFRKIEKSEISKYSLSLIDKEINLYCSIINLNKNQELRDELSPSHQDQDLNKSVLLNISILTEIRWKKNIKSIMIQTHSPYIERGIPNKLKDVTEIKE
ncbi:MAG: hypothetical protein KAV44_05160 [Bacteroidales bacterium]|nr:hypothetical protein [Bacteroidales bacterium]